MVVRRLNYFTGQFLKENDFKDEQKYHVDSLRLHNKHLHTWGIAYGLDVTSSTDAKNVIIGRGMAIDNQGRQIVLDETKEIFFSTATATVVYLTISYNEITTDLKEETGIKGYTRTTEEPTIEFDKNMPDDPSMKIFLAKVILHPENRTVQKIELEDRKYTGTISGDIEANSIIFPLPTSSDKWPIIKGVDGSNPGIAITSQNTSLTGNLKVSGILGGNLEQNMVKKDHISNKSVSIAKMDAKPIEGEGGISAQSEERVHKYISPDNKHCFLLASVIPTTPDSILDWRWQVEYIENTLSYVLVVRNLSDKKINYKYKFYELFE
jgi:hypothetical protein